MKLNWQAEEVVRAIRGQCLHEQAWTANGVAIDTRSLQTGDLFIALKGPNHDAHDYVSQAFAAGATAAIVQRTPSQVPSDAPLLFVDDTFTALQDLGRVGRQRAKAKIIAVTGSVGKTSCKEQLRLMLQAVAPTYANEGSFNNHWGVPLSLSRLPVEATYGVFELGMNHAGELGPLSREVQPHVALITNVEAVHLEFFASTEGIADAKAEIFLGMDVNGTAILNRDNIHFARLLAAARTQGLKQILSFGRDAKAEARLLDYTHADNGGIVKAEILGQKYLYRIGTAGEHIALNSIGTLLTAAAAGANVLACAEALAAYHPPKGRGSQQTITLKTGGTITLIDESFNASPVAIRAAIDALKQTSVTGRRIAVLGDMRELGPTAPRLHSELAEYLTAAKIDVVHCCGEMMSYLHSALPAAKRGHHTLQSADLAPLVAESVEAGDAVMIKGSKSMQMHKVVDAIRTLDIDIATKQKLAG